MIATFSDEGGLLAQHLAESFKLDRKVLLACVGKQLVTTEDLLVLADNMRQGLTDPAQANLALESRLDSYRQGRGFRQRRLGRVGR
jgi:hypothetical protein